MKIISFLLQSYSRRSGWIGMSNTDEAVHAPDAVQSHVGGTRVCP
jgi:hypothetical protein